MSKYTIKDFAIGDKVFHQSNAKLKMVVIEVNESMNEVNCRWIDKDGQVHTLEFLAEELAKANGSSGIVFSTQLP